MSFLADFGGAFFTGVGNEIQQRENEDRQLRLQMALEDRRRRISRQDRFSDLVTENNLNAKPYVGYDSQGRMGLLQDEFAMGDTGPTRTARRLGDAPRVPTKEVERKVGDKIVRYRQFSDGTEEVIAEAPRYRPDGGGSRQEIGEDGLTAYQRAQLEERRKNRERLERNGGKGGERPDNVRKAWDEEAMRIGEMEGEALRSKAAQYGMDHRGLPTDDETLRAALLAQVDAEYGKRLESARSRGGKRDESAPVAGIPPAAVSDLKADPSPQAQAEFDAVFGKGAAKRVLGSR